MPGWRHAVAVLLFEIFLWGSIALALAHRNWYALLLFPAGMTTVLALHCTGGALRATDTSAVSRARLWFAVELGAAAGIVAIAYFLFGSSGNAD